MSDFRQPKSPGRALILHMELDSRACYRALSTRDPRFDGRFFTGVRTTGVYCRPVCPARTPRPENVRFFPCAAAAEAAGFRACRRCRPETSPGTPAWLGTSATVSRALRLISQGEIDARGIEGLAASLGIGARHLRRLFREELGASPVEIAQVRRLHFARRLLAETALPVTRIASSSGFRSIRRFNEAFKDRFGQSPAGLRRLAVPRPDVAGFVELRLAYRPPYDWPGLLDFLGRRAIPGVEEVSGGAYRRLHPEGSGVRRIEVRHRPRERGLLLRVSPPDGDLLGVAERVRRLFDCDADPLAVARALEKDERLAPLVRKRRGLRVPGAFDGFESAVRAILGQQVSVEAANTLAGRLVRRFGAAAPEPEGGLTHVFPAPAALAGADLRQIGIPGARAEALRALARAVAAGEIDFRTRARLEETVARLTRLPGVGPWTAHYAAMRAFGEPDAFPAGDLVLRRSLAAGGPLPSAREAESLAQRWRPWRAYAALHLWNASRKEKR
jgi:AraC family transcriptional regulator of adaptative response / DNA-3-methyladenine glycosylase II